MIEGCVIGVGLHDEDKSEDGVLAHHLMRASLAAFQCRFDQLTPEQQQAVEATARKAMAIESAVLASREAWDIFLPETMIVEAVETVRARYDSHQDFECDLAANGLDEQTLALALSRDMWVDAVLSRVVKDIAPPSVVDAKGWYDSHPAHFAVPERRTARHILITINEDFADNHRDTAQLNIESICNQLDGSVDQFAQLAKQHSECPTAMDGGKLGAVPRGTLYKSLDEMLFKMGEGAVSCVLESEMGFHILLCEAIHHAEIIPFAKAKDRIVDRLFARKRQIAQRQWIESLSLQGVALREA
nr:nitrogen fixation protein NifM [uncultured Cohaesibacter sp.]